MTAWIDPQALIAWIGPDLTEDQALGLADAATAAVRSWIERDLELQEFEEIHDSTGTDYVLVNAWPIRVMTSVAINGERPLALAVFQHPGYALDPMNTRKVRFPGRKVPRGVQNIAVSYTAGYDLTLPPGAEPGLPADVFTALKLTGAAIFNSQAADPNLASENTGGVFTGSFYATGVGAVPPGARTLLQRFKRVA